MKVALGSDHAGFTLKESVRVHLESAGHEVLDVGTSSDETVDYPRFAHAVALRVAKGECDRGIVIDGAGIGSAMAANKVPGVRAALAYDLSSARNSREHNDANVLTLGAGLIGPTLARQIIDVWLSTDCTEPRHLRRVGLISAIERDPLAMPDDAVASRTESPPAPSSARDATLAPAPPADVSEADLDRIARRLQQLLGDLAPAGSPRPAHAPADPSGPSGLAARTGPRVADRPEVARRYLDFGVSRLSTGPEPGAIPDDLARCIDHTLLQADATPEQIRTLCAEAREHGFATVCVNPLWVALAAAELARTPVAVCSVVGFPLGATPSQIKAFEARRAIRDGAREIDMVIPIGALKDGDDAAVLADMRAVVEACRDGGARCKVILEAALLTDDEKRRACRLACQARAHFVKTSTGFGPAGATAHDVELMAAEVRACGMEVKAAGGIRSLSNAQQLIAAGATRLGTSASLAIIAEEQLAGQKEQTRG